MIRPRRRREPAPHLDAPLLVLTGMKREAACVARSGVAPIVSGADVAHLRAALDKLPETEFLAVVSFGLAGGLDYDLRPGDVVVADAIIAGARRHAPHAQLSEALTEAADAAGCRTRRGAIVGVDAAAMDTSAKTLLRESAQAVAVDMESHIAAEFAEKRRLPFVALRAISDPAARALPPLAARALTPDGDIDNMKVALELIRAPRQIGGLILAGLDSRAAFASLRRCGPLLGPLLRLVLSDL